jgi:hypothetical protein
MRLILEEVFDDQQKYSYVDSDDQESDENDSSEEESENEDLEEDDKEDNLSFNAWNQLRAASQKCVFIVKWRQTSEFNLGVISPPPEYA